MEAAPLQLAPLQALIQARRNLARPEVATDVDKTPDTKHPFIAGRSVTSVQMLKPVNRAAVSSLIRLEDKDGEGGKSDNTRINEMRLRELQLFVSK
ncbi:hypothetical protein chiPu_0019009 [Chiloscyllium punctatum]|uniref:Uncharacterized protein n=1 Tax=Chiloscyllium punctatum TaxID=137246 RepID=A0A401RQF3_CHIPU|nr:hypothetical protein [Chiloscyllium punctatum]